MGRRIVWAASPTLGVVPNVELLEVGEDWETLTGLFSFTPDDLVSAIQSQDDPGVRAPVVKLGHADPRFDGQPAFGRVINLRLENNGQTLVGDLAGLPPWITTPDENGNIVLSSAFPRRSIEGAFGWNTRTGNEWPFVLTGLALLGDAYPAISTLEDIQAAWDETPPKLIPATNVDEIAASGPIFRARKLEGSMPKWLRRQQETQQVAASTTPVHAAVALDDVRRAYYESLDASQMWWWVREIRVNPLELIVDDDAGGLLRVPVTVSGSDDITFGDPVEVKVEYVEVAAGQEVAAAFFQPSAAGRPVQASENSTTDDPKNEHTEEGGMKLSADALRSLGLEPDASEEDINAAILQRAQQDPEGQEGEGTESELTNDPDGETPPEGGEQEGGDTSTSEQSPAGTEAPEGVEIPEGMALVDAATLAELRSGVAAARRLETREQERERDQFLDTAVRAGKFPKSRRDHYVKLWAADPSGTRQVIDSLEEGLVPTGERGVAASAPGSEVEQPDETTYPESWGRAVTASQRGVGSSRVKVVSD